MYLRAAVELAAEGLYSCTPNPRVGCLIVRDGRVIGRGAHIRAGEGHAEINALADARRDVAGATVYISLEPCAFHGRTPPCSEALIAANVRRVVVAMTDRTSRCPVPAWLSCARPASIRNVVSCRKRRTSMPAMSRESSASGPSCGSRLPRPWTVERPWLPARAAG